MFAQRLRSIMREKKLSQVEVAKIAKVSEATVSRYLSEQTCLPTISALINLSKALNGVYRLPVGLPTYRPLASQERSSDTSSASATPCE